MKRCLSTCLIVLLIFTATSATAEKTSVKHKTAGRVIKPERYIFNGSIVVSETIRIVTAYNAGDPNQNRGNPCISASGENLCKVLATGQSRCAANFVPMGTELYIDKYGKCIVTDRTNRRYRNRVDIAMGLDELNKAKQFGKKKLNVKILKKKRLYSP